MSLARISNFFETHPVGQKQRLSTWLRFGFWQIRSRMSDMVVVKWIGGTRFWAKRGMTGLTGNIYVGLHEFVDMLFLLHFLRTEDTFGDVGANVGSYTILASGVIGARTIAFEPDPNTSRKFMKNIVLNDMVDRVQLKQYAVGPTSGTIKFTIGKDTMNQVANDDSENVQTVDMVTMDEGFGSNVPIMIKLDVEGFEEEAIVGACGLLANQSLKVIALETVTPVIRERLTEAGFNPLHYDFVSRTLSEQPQDHAASNQLFIRDRDFVADRVASAARIEIFGDAY